MTRQQANSIEALLSRTPLADYPRHSRVHRLRGFGAGFFVKRDDELSFGVSGSKLRKYLSLIPALKGQGIQEAVLIGGASSNNIVGLSQRLIEEGIQPTLFLCGRRPPHPSGNLLLSQLLVDERHIHWHGTEAWPQIEALAAAYTAGRAACCVVAEGASCAEALPGAMSLALDIMDNEAALGVTFDHVVCDAGTGLTAAALLLANSLLGRRLCHHLVLLAQSAACFEAVLQRWKGVLEELSGLKVDSLAPYTLYRSATAPSFGAVNRAVKDEINRLAREEGILSDPVYSAKLFATARTMELPGNVLLIHSGGALGAVANLGALAS